MEYFSRISHISNCEVSIFVQIDSCMLARRSSENYMSWVNEVKCRSTSESTSSLLSVLYPKFLKFIFNPPVQIAWWVHIHHCPSVHPDLTEIGDKSETVSVHVSDYTLRKIRFMHIAESEF